MKRVILVYGLIAGVIVAAMILLSMPLWESGILNFDNGTLVGYTTIVIALSMVFFGIKSYRDNHLNGFITFGKAFQVGILITVIASVMYGLAWDISYRMMGDEFSKKMTEHYMAEMKEEGATQEEMENTKKMFQMMNDNAIFRFAEASCIEIFPVGLVITLISAGLLRKKELLPAT